MSCLPDFSRYKSTLGPTRLLQWFPACETHGQIHPDHPVNIWISLTRFGNNDYPLCRRLCVLYLRHIDYVQNSSFSTKTMSTNCLSYIQSVITRAELNIYIWINRQNPIPVRSIDKCFWFILVIFHRENFSHDCHETRRDREALVEKDPVTCRSRSESLCGKGDHPRMLVQWIQSRFLFSERLQESTKCWEPP